MVGTTNLCFLKRRLKFCGLRKSHLQATTSCNLDLMSVAEQISSPAACWNSIWNVPRTDVSAVFCWLEYILVELDTVEVTPCIFFTKLQGGLHLVLNCTDPTFMVLHWSHCTFAEPFKSSVFVGSDVLKLYPNLGRLGRQYPPTDQDVWEFRDGCLYQPLSTFINQWLIHFNIFQQNL